MTGVLFIINVPQKEHELLLRKTNIQSETEPAETKDDLHITITDKGFDAGGLYKSTSKITLNVENGNGYLKSFWEELKQVLKAKRRKLKITRPVRGVDVLAAFQWDTPLEIILSEVISRLDVKDATWCATKNNIFWQVTFSLESGSVCEELLQVLRTFGIGTRHQSSLSLVPCTLFYGNGDHLSPDENAYDKDFKTTWSRFSTSVKARTNLAQVLHAAKADAAITFDWLFLLLVAALVAGVGLVENSTIVLVASMLISPLMGPITAGTLGTAVRDRYLQIIGVTHELLGLFLCVVIGFILGLAICAVDGRYPMMNDWPSTEMMSRCEYRSLWTGVLIAIPSGAGVALSVLGDYTASHVGVAISASLLPPAVNAGLLWGMSLYRLMSPDDMTWRVGQPYELAILGTRSLCLTLINIVCIFVAGVAVYKVKKVCPLERRDISWWRAKKSRLQSPKGHNTTAWNIYSKWSNDSSEAKSPVDQNTQSDTVTFRRPRVLQRMKAQDIEDSLRNVQFGESYQRLDTSESTSESQNSENSSKDSSREIMANSPEFCFYNLGNETKESQEEHPTLEPSLSFTVDAKRNGKL